MVTGGASGIGEAIAKTLAGKHVTVIAGSRRSEKLESASATGEYEGANLITHPLDVADNDSIEAFMAFAKSHAPNGIIDILVNAAGISVSQPVCGHDDIAWQSVIDINLTGAFRMTRAVLPAMMSQKWGRIVNIGSTAATTGDVDSPAYCASKAGLLGLTRCVALEGAAHAVTCNMVSPTWIDTPMMRNSMARWVNKPKGPNNVSEAMQRVATDNPQQRVLQAEEVASVVKHLCSEEAKGLTMENIKVTGGANW